MSPVSKVILPVYGREDVPGFVDLPRPSLRRYPRYNARSLSDATIVVKSPQEFGDGEIRMIEVLVRPGGKADTRNLMENLRNACYLGAIFIGGGMVGAGVIKRLGVHLSTVVHRSKFPDLKGSSSEMGHFCVDPSHRGRGLAKRLFESLLESCRNTLYATTREDNQAMQQILEQSGFKPVGKPWASRQSPGKKICLWIEPWKSL